MEKEQFEITMVEYLAGELTQTASSEFEEYLKNNPVQRAEFESLQQTWGKMDEAVVPETSEAMDVRFFEMLHIAETEKANKSTGFVEGLSSFMSLLWRPQVAYGILLVAIGLGTGYFMSTNTAQSDTPNTVVVDNETEEVREQLVLTLLEQPSANQRLQGVNEANKIEKVDEKVIKALLQTLNNDANVNVRLAAIEALVNYVDKPIVREGLIQAIGHQESPIVQVTLADLMVALQEKKSIAPFKALIRSKELDTSVKEKLESSIQQII